MIDIILLLIVAGVTWCVASEGPWGAASTLIAVILAGLLAMNYFEPLASRVFPASGDWSVRADCICLLGLFGVFVTLLRMAGEALMPTQLEVHPLAYDAARWGLGAVTGYVTMAVLLTALHTAALPREFLGFRAERHGGNLFDMMAPDRQWLGFTQHASENIFTTGRVFDGMRFERMKGAAPEVWSSFPIRYADRRERYAAGGGMLAGSSGPPVGPPPSNTPRGGRTGAGGF